MQLPTVRIRNFWVALVLMLGTITIGLGGFASEGLSQTEAKPAARQDPGQKSKTPPKKKKPPAPFKWVNPLNEKERQFPGLKQATFNSPSLNTEIGYCIYLPPNYDLVELQNKRFPVIYYLHGGRPGSERKSVKLISTS